VHLRGAQEQITEFKETFDLFDEDSDQRPRGASDGDVCAWGRGRAGRVTGRKSKAPVLSQPWLRVSTSARDIVIRFHDGCGR
jgi:hypothetical protein